MRATVAVCCVVAVLVSLVPLGQLARITSLVTLCVFFAGEFGAVHARPTRGRPAWAVALRGPVRHGAHRVVGKLGTLGHLWPVMTSPRLPFG